MKNYLVLFMTFFASMFSGMFMNKSVSHKDRIHEKMARHNAEAFEKMRNGLSDYAKQFLLPLSKRNKKGELIKTRMVKKYEKFLARRKTELLLKRGHSTFTFMGQEFTALNEKNAERKKLLIAESLL